MATAVGRILAGGTTSHEAKSPDQVSSAAAGIRKAFVSFAECSTKFKEG